MKKLVFTLLTILVSVAGLIGCAVVSGSGQLVTKTFDAKDFNRVEIGNNFTAEITQGTIFSVTVTIDDNIEQYLDVQVLGSTLHIGLTAAHTYIHSTQRAAITMPSLNGLFVSGASKTNLNNFKSTDTLETQVSGASTVNFVDCSAGNTTFDVTGASKMTGDMTINNGSMHLSGASSANLVGTGGNVTIEVSGASSAKLESFALTNADVSVSGASNATINASGILDVNLSGASKLFYVGSPTLGNISITGASNMSRK